MGKTIKSQNFSTAQSDIPYSVYPTIDMDGPALQNMIVSGSITGLLTSNRAPNSQETKSVIVKLLNTGDTKSLSFETHNYEFLGGVPTGLKSGSTAYVGIVSIGTGENDVVINYDELGSELYFSQGSVVFTRDYEVSGTEQFNFQYPNGLTGVPQLTLSGDFMPNTSGLNSIGSRENPWGYVETKALALLERSSDPSNPEEGQAIIFLSDGSAAGDDGDIMVKIKAGGVTKTIKLVDFSAS